MFSRIKKFFIYPRFNYEVWSNEKLIGEGWNKHSVALRHDIDNFINELSNPSNPSGDGFTFMITKK